MPEIDPLSSQAATGVAATAKGSRFAYAMRALGSEDPPAGFTVDGKIYHRTKIIKHDFFAATAFYADEAGHQAVAKFGRVVDFYGLPLLWIGKFLSRRELRFYQKLAHLPNIPRVVGVLGETGFIHDYVVGEPLSKQAKIPDTFFDELHGLIESMHKLGVAYVDTNKPENILLGEDGRPYLIDFQISWDVQDLGNNPINRWWLRHLKTGDVYHIYKHKKRFRPDQLTEEQAKLAVRRGFMITLHRIVTRPYFIVRRKWMKKLNEKGKILPAGSN